jgi:N-acetylneuraminate synthase
MINYSTPKIIAEIGCNHKGSISIAKELIDLANFCGADVAKFQKRNPKELLSKEQYNAPHPVPGNSYGDTYGKHREFLEFDIHQHAILKDHCEKVGIEYSTSVWDVTSATEMVSLNPKMLKVPSACNNNFDLLKILRDIYKGEVHVSTGMSTAREIADVITFFSIGKDKDAAKNRLVIYSCTSGYPVKFTDVCLLEITRLKEKYEKKVKSIAFSGHHLGIAVDIAAYALGAEYIERHFTKDRTWKGTDHAASLEPAGLKKLVRDLHATCAALSYKESEILLVEAEQRKKLKYSK